MALEQAEALQVEMWRRLSLEDRFRIVAAMIEDGFAQVAASIRAVHPEYSPEEFRADLAKRIYGDDIAGRLESWEAGRLGGERLTGIPCHDLHMGSKEGDDECAEAWCGLPRSSDRPQRSFVGDFS